MKSLSRMVRDLLWALLIGWAVSLLRRWLISAVARRNATGPRDAKAPAPVSLHRDPSCGVYVSPEISYTLEQAGQIEHFCSAACRDRYLRFQQHAVSA